jgi:hypothetical protein
MENLKIVFLQILTDINSRIIKFSILKKKIENSLFVSRDATFQLQIKIKKNVVFKSPILLCKLQRAQTLVVFLCAIYRLTKK